MDKIGFIGCGNMGGAIARAVCRQAGPGRLLLANRTPAKAEALAQELGCAAADNDTVFRDCRWIFLAVKPQMMPGVLAAAAPLLRAREDRFVLVTMAAGLTMEKIGAMAGGAFPILRIMPNTPVAIGEGMTQYCSRDVTDEELREFLYLMAPTGRLDALDEPLIDAASGVSGCGPAYACLFLEALADGGVACGLPRGKAMEYAAQMLVGTAKLALESGQHPGAMKDAVCSPGGSTIQGVRALEQAGFRAAVMEAVIAAWQKNRELGK